MFQRMYKPDHREALQELRYCLLHCTGQCLHRLWP